MATIIPTDSVMSRDSARLLSEMGWQVAQDPLSELVCFTKRVWLSSDDRMLNAPLEGSFPLDMRIVTDTIFGIRRVGFLARDAELSPEDPISKRLSALLLSDLKTVRFLDKGEIVEALPAERAVDHVLARARILGVELMPPVVRYVPEELWSTFGFDSGVEAAYSLNHREIYRPKKRVRSPNWSDSVDVHELVHALQHAAGWILTPTEAGVDLDTFKAMKDMMADGLSIEHVCWMLGIDRETMIRVKAIMDSTDGYQERYLEIPSERHAISEQVAFLRSIGLDEDRIEAAVVPFMISEGRNKDPLVRMIRSPFDAIEEAITEQRRATHAAGGQEIHIEPADGRPRSG